MSKWLGIRSCANGQRITDLGSANERLVLLACGLRFVLCYGWTRFSSLLRSFLSAQSGNNGLGKKTERNLGEREKWTVGVDLKERKEKSFWKRRAEDPADGGI